VFVASQYQLPGALPQRGIPYTILLLTWVARAPVILTESLYATLLGFTEEVYFFSVESYKCQHFSFMKQCSQVTRGPRGG